MSRTATKKSCTWSEAKKFLKAHDVVLISAGLDEIPSETRCFRGDKCLLTDALIL
jgi:hypothetical protein